MAELTIDGYDRPIVIDDGFKALPPHEQEAVVRDIRSKLGLAAPVMEAPATAEAAQPPRMQEDASGQRWEGGVPVGGVALAGEEPQPGAPKYGGSGMNFTAGMNEALYGTAGGLVDLARGGLNLGVRGIEAATGADLPEIPENSFLGSRWIGETLGEIRPELDPQNTAATTDAERLARAGGQGVGYSVGPQAVLGAATRAGVVPARAVETTTRLFGPTDSARAVATNAAIGSVSGVGSEAAMQASPDEYDGVAGMAGGLATGTVASLAAGLPSLLRAGAKVAGDYFAPMTEAGRQRLAGEQFRAGISDIEAVRDTLDNIPADIVPGSMPTTGQLTGDRGILAAERGSAVKRPDLYAERRETQNSARLAALEGVQSGGAPEKVADAFRARLQAMDEEITQASNQATAGARAQADALGMGATPDIAGERIRADLEARRAAAKASERSVWGLVDPDGKLALSPQNAKAAAQTIRRSHPRSAKPIEGEEASIIDTLSSYGEVVPLSELRAAQSRLTDAMRAERMANGESAAYARLSRINSGIHDDLARVVRGRVAREEFEVQNGRMDPADTLAAKLEAVTAPSVGDAVFTPSGRRVGVRYELAEADSLNASSLPDGRANPTYPAELQPRDRTRAASDAQIASISRNLQPERLGASSSAAEGAPIVGADGVVESGNGRTLGIRRAYAENGEGARAYRDYLQAQGYDTTGFRQPVLIRRRTTDLAAPDRVRFAQEANASSSMAMSASEQAKTDASRMGADLLDLYRGGDLASADNRDFTRAFLRSVPDRGQEGGFVTADGALSLDGAQRMRNALLFSAYRDPRLVASLADEGDENIRSFGRALTDLSGDVARLRAGVDAGRIDRGADVSGPMIEAARIVQSARARNVKLSDAIAQQDAFDRTSPEALDVLRLAYGDALTGRLSRERLRTIMKDVVAEAEQQSADARLFGGALDAATILQGAKVRYGNATIPASADAGIRNARPGGGEVRPGERGLGRAADGQADLAGRTGAEGRRVLDEPALTDNFDRDALDRLSAARDATRQRAETFDNDTLRPIRARSTAGGAYDLPASAVPSRLFFPQAKSFDAIQQARRAIGDERLLPALQDYAIDRARKLALRDDGTFDPAKLATFRRAHADALRAVPGLDARFANAAAASETMGDAVRRRVQAQAQRQTDTLGKLLQMDTPEDVTRVIGSIFSAQDANLRMSRVRAAIGGDEEARQGLKQAIVDHIRRQFISNGEAGASGERAIKADGFQSFVRKNASTLRGAGFSDEEMRTMQGIADDLQRANRSITAVKNPGGSDTAQNAYAAAKGGNQPTILTRIVTNAPAAGVGLGGFMVGGGSWGGAIVGGSAALGAKVLGEMRLAGINSVDDLVTDALLNPSRARALLFQPSKETLPQTAQTIGQMYRRAALAVMATTNGSEETKPTPRKRDAAGAAR